MTCGAMAAAGQCVLQLRPLAGRLGVCAGAQAYEVSPASQSAQLWVAGDGGQIVPANGVGDSVVLIVLHQRVCTAARCVYEQMQDCTGQGVSKCMTATTQPLCYDRL